MPLGPFQVFQALVGNAHQAVGLRRTGILPRGPQQLVASQFQAALGQVRRTQFQVQGRRVRTGIQARLASGRQQGRGHCPQQPVA